VAGIKLVISGLRGLEVTFAPHDPSDAGSNPAEVVELLRKEKFKSSGRDFKLFDPCSRFTAMLKNLKPKGGL
jgi:hypothetical protein